MKLKMGWIGFLPVIALTCGCSMEVGGREPLESISVSQTPLLGSAYFFQDWTKGYWSRSLALFPGAFVAMVQTSTGTGAIFRNLHDFPIEFGGEFGYACTPNAPIGLGAGTNLFLVPGHFESPGQGLIVQGNDFATVTFPPCDPTSKGAGKLVIWSGGAIDYRPALPAGAVPFHDAFAVLGDQYNFFPNDQMRLSSGTPVARSAALYVGDAPFHNLYIRYANAHPNRPAALVKVGIQNLDAGGATVKAFNQVAFPITQATNDFSQWQLVRVDLSTPASVQNIYVRLEMKSADIVYLDATWMTL